ncbi:aspartyl-tRNA(Asn)/glutamyl-tRNA(Gln) amidotransferase subunit B, partial [Tremellales sp. Uapishka_1]
MTFVYSAARGSGGPGPVSARFQLRNLSRRRFSTHAGDSEWETVIGLEIHAQLKTGRKLFSGKLRRQAGAVCSLRIGAPLSHADSPNTHVEVLDAALPGALPVLDPEAIRLSLLTSLALNCKINPRSTFDRKHYFYHDIPSSYQITQHYNPLARSGSIRISKGENGSQRTFDVGIQQLQVEQDTAKSQTVGGEVLVDLNRAGTGLMEIVTDPDMRSAEEAGAFVKKLQSLLRRLGAGDGDMEKPFGTRCELKNINSVRYLQQAIEAERKRHILHYEQNPSTSMKQETRSLDESTGETFSLRSKEEAEDYRYMPDSNLPAMLISPTYLDKLRGSLPEMPWETLERLPREYGIEFREAETLAGLDEYGGAGVAYFEESVGGNRHLGKKAANWINHDLLGQLTRANRPWSAELLPSSLLRDILLSVESNELSGSAAKQILKHAVSLPSSSPIPADLHRVLNDLGLAPLTAEGLEAIAVQVLQDMSKEVESVRKGNGKVIMRLVGEVMKRTGGRADGRVVREVLMGLLKVKYGVVAI